MGAKDDGRPAARNRPLGTAIGDASNVLLLAAGDGHADEACVDLLAVAEPAREAVAVVATTRSPEEWFDAWRTHTNDRPPAELGFVRVGARRVDEGTARSDAPVTVLPVFDADGPAGIGIALTEYFAAWAADDAQLAVCFDSLAVPLSRVGLDGTLRFLHLLTGQVRRAGGVAHYHLDPHAWGERTRRAVEPLFDAVVERDDGRWTVRRG